MILGHTHLGKRFLHEPHLICWFLFCVLLTRSMNFTFLTPMSLTMPAFTFNKTELRIISVKIFSAFGFSTFVCHFLGKVLSQFWPQWCCLQFLRSAFQSLWANRSPLVPDGSFILTLSNAIPMHTMAKSKSDFQFLLVFMVEHLSLL